MQPPPPPPPTNAYIPHTAPMQQQPPTYPQQYGNYQYGGGRGGYGGRGRYSKRGGRGRGGRNGRRNQPYQQYGAPPPTQQFGGTVPFNGTIPPPPTIQKPAQQGNQTPVKYFNNWNICCKCGWDVPIWHTSATCPYKHENPHHNDAIDRNNAQAWMDRGWTVSKKQMHKKFLPANPCPDQA